ncbi:MAG TPA: HEAT repeat domain-containing protein [Candidatus Dormibacteraeota bacterium]|nr:HEAT repeat domain-containing protein [Candidatus Dormibacteraeota bacterium]
MSQPAYNGKTLTQWVNELEGNAVAYFHTRTLHPEAVDAVRAIGREALPFLVQWLVNPRIFERPPRQIFERAKMLGPLAIPAATIGSLAWHHEFPSAASTVLAFKALGPLASPAIPELRQVIQVSNSPSWIEAVQALAAIGAEAVPVLLEFVNQLDDWHLQTVLIEGFGTMGSTAREAIPAIIECATFPDPRVRYAAVYALAGMTEDADAVLPTLLKAIEDADAMVRRTAVRAIGRFGRKAYSYIRQYY